MLFSIQSITDIMFCLRSNFSSPVLLHYLSAEQRVISAYAVVTFRKWQCFFYSFHYFLLFCNVLKSVAVMIQDNGKSELEDEIELKHLLTF